MARNYGAPFTNNETGNKESDTSEADAIAAKAVAQNKDAVDRRTQRVNKKFTEGDRASHDPTGSKMAGLNEDLATFVNQGQISEGEASTTRSLNQQMANDAGEKREALDKEIAESASKATSATEYLLQGLDKSNRPKEMTASQKRAAAAAAAKAENSKKRKRGRGKG
jgi:hypothetical protein